MHDRAPLGCLLYWYFAAILCRAQLGVTRQWWRQPRLRGTRAVAVPSSGVRMRSSQVSWTQRYRHTIAALVLVVGRVLGASRSWAFPLK